MTRLRRAGLAAVLLLAAAQAVELVWSGVGGLLLLLAVAAAGVGLWLEAGSLYTGSRRWSRAARRLQAGAAALLAAALGLLASAFLRADVGYAYVWAHTARTLPWYYRLAGTWAGEAGTILLWAAVAGFGLLALLDRLEDEAEAPLAGATHLVVGGFVAALAAFLVTHPPFAATPPARLADPATAGGAGLNELLVTPLMVIHPPIQFLAYGLTALPGGLALAGLAAGDEAWLAPARTWGRRAWVAATAGLGLGALWAYYVLSFGGYWVWDPVETANVLPWVGVLAFLHAARDRSQTGGGQVTVPVLAAASWAATVFATVAVRSGLWTSVHAFTDPTDVFQPDAGRRLLDILGVHAPTRFFSGLLLALTFLAVAAVLRRHGPGLAEAPHRRLAVQAAVGLAAAGAGLALFVPRLVLSLALEAGRLLVPGSPAVGLGAVATLAIAGPVVLAWAATGDEAAPHAWSRFQRLAALLLGLAGAVTFLLLLRSVNGFTPAFYDHRVPLVALPIVVAMTAMLAWDPLGPRRALTLAGVAGAGAAVTALVLRDRWVLVGAVPALGLALAAGLARLRHVAWRRDRDPRHEAAGGLILAAGLLGLLTWSNPPDAVPLPGGLLPVPAVLAGLLWPASLVAVAGSLAAWRGGPHRLARAGGLAGILAAGLGVGALLGAAGLALHERTASRGPASWTAYKAAGRRFAIHLAHVGALVGLLGWAASTYGGATGAFTAAPGGDPVSFEGMTLTLGEAQGEPADGGDWFTALNVPVAVDEDGTARADGRLRLYHRPAPVDHYDPHVDVNRGVDADVVLHPRAFELEGDRWVEAHGDTARVATDDVTQVRFTAELRPGMSLLWTGLTLVVGGTAALAALDGTRRREAL